MRWTSSVALLITQTRFDCPSRQTGSWVTSISSFSSSVSTISTSVRSILPFCSRSMTPTSTSRPSGITLWDVGFVWHQSSHFYFFFYPLYTGIYFQETIMNSSLEMITFCMNCTYYIFWPHISQMSKNLVNLPNFIATFFNSKVLTWACCVSSLAFGKLSWFASYSAATKCPVNIQILHKLGDPYHT